MIAHGSWDMEPMPSTDDINPYAPYRDFLLTFARKAMEHGIRHGAPPPMPDNIPDPILLETRATFITIERHGQLRGCIGRVVAEAPLMEDIAEHAVAAAIHDPRFMPLTIEETKDAELSISILTDPEPMTVKNEIELVQRLVPGRDGLILREGRRGATFLPSVWEELPDPYAFVQHLKMKAGWPANYWSDGIKVQRYRSHYLTEQHT